MKFLYDPRLARGVSRAVFALTGLALVATPVARAATPGAPPAAATETASSTDTAAGTEVAATLDRLQQALDLGLALSQRRTAGNPEQEQRRASNLGIYSQRLKRFGLLARVAASSPVRCAKAQPELRAELGYVQSELKRQGPAAGVVRSMLGVDGAVSQLQGSIERCDQNGLKQWSAFAQQASAKLDADPAAQRLEKLRTVRERRSTPRALGSTAQSGTSESRSQP